MTKRLTIALVALAMFVLVAAMPVSADSVGTWYQVAPGINQSATVFVGEQGLNITNAMAQANAAGTPTTISTIGWWASASQLQAASPDATVSIDDTRMGNFYVNPTEFDMYQGEWYLVDPANNNHAKNGTAAVFNVKAPSLEVTLRDPVQAGADVSNKAVPLGTQIQFRIGTNMYTTLTLPTTGNPLRYPIVNATGFNSTTGAANPINDGYIDLVVKTESGSILSTLYTSPDGSTFRSIKALAVWTQPFNWGMENRVPATAVNWSTDAIDPLTQQKAYKAGDYIVYATSKLNNMNGNYLNGGAAYTGRTVSQTVTIKLVSDTVKITVNKDSIVRTKDFSVTITGKPSTYYNVWIKNTHNMALGAVNNEPPLVTSGQDRVVPGDFTPRAPFIWSTRNYSFQNAPSLTVGTDAFGNVTANAFSYASVRTNTAGTWTLGFSTTANTKAQKYTIRVEQNFGTGCAFTTPPAYSCASNDFKSDQVDVKVEKGAVTVVAAGDQSYYLGEEVKFSGTNTESDTTYLSIIGPNLPTLGAQLPNPRTGVTNGVATTFEQADVQSDNTWSYKWGTSALALDAGTYTIYAMSQPVDNEHLNEVAYGTVSIIIKKPFVSATASQSTVAKADKLFITGTAEGQPSAGVAIWILGKNKALYATETVNSDSSFKYEVTSDMTRNLYAGQYFVVVQHPMQNNNFDIAPSPLPLGTGQPVGVYNYVLGNVAATGGTLLFWLEGTGSLQGSDAAEALVQAINDPNVDDTYTKLQFLVEEPVINIVPVGDKHVGDKFTIKALTNLAVDDEILVEVYSSSFKPTQKSQSGEFSGATGTVKVTKGDSGMNSILFDVDASTFKPDEYIVSESAVIQGTTGTALFNVLEGAAPTAVPTTVATAVPTTVATPVPTTVPPTPTPTKSPGYGALIALIGLGAVAFIVVRRH